MAHKISHILVEEKKCSSSSNFGDVFKLTW